MTAAKTTLALKFLKPGAIGPYSGFQWPMPNGKPGKWVTAKGDIIACENGIHATTLEHATEWVQRECYVIELSGVVIDAGDKLVARKGRLVRRVEIGDRELRLFAADCAAHVLKHFEKRYPEDKRPREAIKAARRFARRPTARNRALMQDARAVAGAAAYAYAAYAAYAAASAAYAANAAYANANAYAYAAEREWQADRLRRYLIAPEVLA